MADGNVAGGTGEPPRVLEEADVEVCFGKLCHQRRCAVVRLAIDDEDLKAIRI